MVDINLMPEKIKGESVGLGDFLSRNAALAFVIGLLFLLFIIYSGLVVYEEVVLVNEKIGLEKDIEALNSEIQDSLPLLSRAQELETKLKSLKNDEKTGLLDHHIYFSNLFKFLEEEITHPQVSFSSFSASSETGEISLPARAASYSIAAKQLVAIQEQKDIELVSFGGVSINPDGGVSFSLTIKVDPEIFRK